ncbi:acid survival sensor histidine kinase [Helicobacter pylori]|uniref:acid survival sensor histidine kinase n=1 Tax=Helicobacter pylori TaxID=210 RepID=UPI001FD70C35|nr:acid survival sensor histidine kinase [Helicobacter pylori]UOR73198.1 acid survival sensor histidine kinase [Helicobacter pylori]
MKKSKRLKRPYLKRSHLKHSYKASSFKGLLKKEDNVISLENFKPKESEDLLENFSNKKDMQELLGLLNQFILQSYKVEKEFKDYKALYEWVIEILPQAIWVVNENGSFFYKNSLANQSHEVFNKAKLENFNTEIEHENKSYLVQQNSIQGKQIITATDISAQKRQERLASMGKISAHLAHEIRNPVGSISLLASVLLKHANEKTKPIVVELQKALWRVERIIKATLLFSKGIQTNRTKQSLKTLESDLKEALNCYTYSKDIDFLFNFSDEEGFFDFDLMGIVLQNFLYNAIDAIEALEESEQGQVKIEAFIQNEFIVFTIIDNGKEVENKSALFEPFETTKLKGNGLGLALSLQVVKAHEGSIALLENQEKTFEIKILNAS